MAGPLNTSILGLSLLVFLTACSKEGPQEPLAPRVYVQQVTTRELAPPIQLSGDIQARVETQLSFRVGGKIIERKVDVGDHVQAHQVLARLDPKDLNKPKWCKPVLRLFASKNCCPRVTPAKANTMLPMRRN